MQFRQANNKQKQNNNDTNNLALQHYSMTAVRNNTLEETMTKQEVGYGAIDDTNPEPQKTPHKITRRTTYGILLFVISFFLVAGAGAGAGATRSSLRSDTASIVVSSEGYPSVADLEKSADLAQGKADAAAIVATKKAAVVVAAEDSAEEASVVASEANTAAIAARTAAKNGGEKEKVAVAIAIDEADKAAIANEYWLAAVDNANIASAKANSASAIASQAASVAAAALATAKANSCGVHGLICTKNEYCSVVPLPPFYFCFTE